MIVVRSFGECFSCPFNGRFWRVRLRKYFNRVLQCFWVFKLGPGFFSLTSPKNALVSQPENTWQKSTEFLITRSVSRNWHSSVNSIKAVVQRHRASSCELPHPVALLEIASEVWKIGGNTLWYLASADMRLCTIPIRAWTICPQLSCLPTHLSSTVSLNSRVIIWKMTFP